MPQPPRVTVHHADCPDYADGGSCADMATNEIWLAPNSGSFERWHEIGHLFDAQVLTDPDRAWFMRAFRMTGEWVRGTGDECLGKRCPDELFADAYAACANDLRPEGRRRDGMTVSDWTTSYGYFPTARQHRRVCNGIAVIGLVRLADA